MFAISKSSRAAMSCDASESAKGMAFGSHASIPMPRCANAREIPKREVYVRLEIRHRFFARLAVAATVDRTRIVHSSDRPHPIAAGWRLRRQEYAPDASIGVHYIEIVWTPVDGAQAVLVCVFEN